MTAEEARDLTRKQRIGLGAVLDAIKVDAEAGNTFHVTPINLMFDTELVGELFKLGYNVKSREDPHTGLTYYVITW